VSFQFFEEVHFRTPFISDTALHHHMSIAQLFKTLNLKGQRSTLEFTCKTTNELCSETFTNYLPQQNIQNNMVLLTALCLRDRKVSSTRRITTLGMAVKPCSMCSTLATRQSHIKSNTWRLMISVNTSLTVGWTLQYLHLSDEHYRTSTCRMNTTALAPVGWTLQHWHLSDEHYSTGTCRMNTTAPASVTTK
jgi:hypothetical protein